jgi:hypothetical protein
MVEEIKRGSSKDDKGRYVEEWRDPNGSSRLLCGERKAWPRVVVASPVTVKWEPKVTLPEKAGSVPATAETDKLAQLPNDRYAIL